MAVKLRPYPHPSDCTPGVACFSTRKSYEYQLARFEVFPGYYTDRSPRLSVKTAHHPQHRDHTLGVPGNYPVETPGVTLGNCEHQTSYLLGQYPWIYPIFTSQQINRDEHTRAAVSTGGAKRHRSIETGYHFKLLPTVCRAQRVDYNISCLSHDLGDIRTVGHRGLPNSTCLCPFMIPQRGVPPSGMTPSIIPMVGVVG